MEFDGSVKRWRRPTKVDPYNSERIITGSWKEATSATIDGAWVASTSSSAMRAESRVQVLTAKSLFLDDPEADVQTGDGISDSANATGPEYIVEATPAADPNPFTDWQPVREVPLVSYKG